MDAEARIACPSCGHRNRADRRYCAQCGDRLGETCAACGTLNEIGVRFCGHCGASLTGTAAEGERRQLTVLFCDLVGSTAIAGRLDPEDWREVAAQYQRAAAETVTRFGGHVAKYLGDGLLVYFGYPQAHEDDPERAVRGGLALLDTVAELNRRLEPAHGVRLAVRVGMHTGPVVIGEGAGSAAEVFGDTPNVAARVQALADPDAVLVTEATHRLVAGRFIVEAKGSPPLKGVRTPVPVYRVVQASGVRGRLQAAGARGLTPFVGREVERRVLQDRWGQVRSGEGQVVLIGGEAGIGKSRLVQAFKEELGAVPHTWIECGGSPYHRQTPFYAVAEMLGQALAWRGDEPVEERVTRLEQALAAVGFDPGDAVPLLAPLLGLPLPERYSPLALTSEAQRKRLLATMVAWVFGLARRQPAVVVLEDLQWVDPSTLELQGMLVERCDTVPLLILYTARPEFRPPWPIPAHHAQMTLGRLGRAHVHEMVTRVAARAALADLVDAVVTRTDGVPLFVEELTKAVLEAEGSAITPGQAIPATLQDSLMARLDRLGPAKEVAQVASVIGREFPYALLHAVSPLTDAELQTSLTRLMDAELVYARGVAPEATYLFKHALVREAAYESLLKTHRRELHRAIATALAEKFQEAAEAQPELLAHHWTEAGENERAVGAWQQAGEREAARSAYVEATSHLMKGIALLETMPQTPERVQQRFLMGVVLYEAVSATKGYGSPELAELVAQGEGLEAGQPVDSPQLFLLLLGRWGTGLARGEMLAAQANAERLVEIAEKTQARPSLLWAYFARGDTDFHRGRFAAARQDLGRAMTFWDEDGRELVGPDPGVMLLSYASVAAWQSGFADEARARARDGLALARKRRNAFEVVGVQALAGILNIYLRDSKRALEQSEALIRECTEQQFSSYLGHALIQRGWALGHVGRRDEAVAELRRALDAVRRSGNRPLYALGAGLLAEVLIQAGTLEEAARALEEALGSVVGAEIEWPEWLRLRGDLLVRQGAEAAAIERAYRDAIELARSQEARSYELRAATSLARWLQSLGRAGEARGLLAPVLASFTEGFETVDLVDAKAVLAELG